VFSRVGLGFGRGREAWDVGVGAAFAVVFAVAFPIARPPIVDRKSGMSRRAAVAWVRRAGSVLAGVAVVTPRVCGDDVQPIRVATVIDMTDACGETDA
jgi:hypothetical protein